MSKTVIKIENVSKLYKLGLVGTGTLSHDINRWWQLLRGKQDPYLKVGQLNDKSVKGGDFVWALKDINLNIEKGSVIGIIGGNGSGKSTLLKLLSQVTIPTTGTIKIKGKISSLLEVGTGFHPELTGIENIYLNGSILGMSNNEIKSKIEAIIDFSGIEKYINTPVKRYSSGMLVRLGFAVAAHMEPDILIVDEVLAVGDAEFQKKCLGKMKDVSEEGRTILFVSHNMSVINNLCNKGILLSNGLVEYIGSSSDAIKNYLRKNDIKQHFGKIDLDNNINDLIYLNSVKIFNNENVVKNNFEYFENLNLELNINVVKSDINYYCIVYVNDSQGNQVFHTADNDLKQSNLSKASKGLYQYYLKFPSNLLKPGQYFISVNLTHKIHGSIKRYEFVIDFDIIDNSSYRSINNGYRSTAIVAPNINWDLKSLNLKP